MNLDRRRLLGVLAGVTAGGASASAFARSGSANAGATFDASDVTVESDDGSLRALTVAPAGTTSWSGLEAPARQVSIVMYAKLDTDLEYHRLDSQRLGASGLHGETDYAFGTRNLLATSAFSAGDFEPSGDGQTRTRTVRLRLVVTVTGTDGTELTSGHSDATFEVSVENLPESADADGDANTGAEAGSEDGGDDSEDDGKGGSGDDRNENGESEDNDDGGNGEDGTDGEDGNGNGEDENGDDDTDGSKKDNGEKKENDGRGDGTGSTTTTAGE
ncbi:hypothetical protein [Halorussus salinisoli]|uniref:hypothetical protein n=1 Tax=Halorussus salinisoli TaxID=2558242 RepID=UPI0010C1AA8A|nr:hypothetical protein [Halorussus salinisoli]